MGLKDKLKKYNEEHKEDGFHPLELTEGNVQAIFNRCLKKEDDVTAFARIMQEQTGIEQSDVLKALGVKQPENYLFPLDLKRIKENSKSISYLFGQLAGVHARDKLMSWQYGIFNYHDKKWTTDVSILENFYLLGAANLTITLSTPPDDKETLLVDLSHIQPTLSPKDPNFPVWWEEHKGEWEQ